MCKRHNQPTRKSSRTKRMHKAESTFLRTNISKIDKATRVAYAKRHKAEFTHFTKGEKAEFTHFTQATHKL